MPVATFKIEVGRGDTEEHDNDPDLGSVRWNECVAVRPVPADGEGRQPRERLVQRVADDELELCRRCGSVTNVGLV